MNLTIPYPSYFLHPSLYYLLSTFIFCYIFFSHKPALWPAGCSDVLYLSIPSTPAAGDPYPVETVRTCVFHDVCVPNHHTQRENGPILDNSYSLLLFDDSSVSLFFLGDPLRNFKSLNDSTSSRSRGRIHSALMGITPGDRSHNY